MLVDQENGMFPSETQQLMLERTVHLPDLGHHTLM